MKKNQRGFGQIEVLLLAVIIGLVGFVGWYVWHSRNSITTNQNEPRNLSGAFETAPKDTVWMKVTTAKLALPRWSLYITLPAELVNKAVYQYDLSNDSYDFSLSAIVADSKCTDFFNNTVLKIPGIEMRRFDQTTNAHGQIGAAATDTETLLDFYTKHKSATGNYFTDADTGRNYYNFNYYFFVLLSDSPTIVKQQLASFSASCPNIDANWQQPFIDSAGNLSN